MAEQDEIDRLSRILMLVLGLTTGGGRYWVYVSVLPSRYEAFKAAIASKAYNMQEFDADGYGEVLVSGEGRTPPQDVTVQLSKLFNIPVGELFRLEDPKETIRMKIAAAQA